MRASRRAVSCPMTSGSTAPTAEASERLISDGNRVTRAVLDYELKREYQAFLQAPNRDAATAQDDLSAMRPRLRDGRTSISFPMVDDHVQFPDVRIEYERPDGRRDIEDVEVMTPHYRGAHAASKVQAGFTRYGAMGARLGGARGSLGAAAAATRAWPRRCSGDLRVAGLRRRRRGSLRSAKPGFS